jgi:hypothetical protein
VVNFCLQFLQSNEDSVDVGWGCFGTISDETEK